jgi:protein TonB
VVKAVAAPPARIQVTSEVQEAMVLVMVRPEYPPLARRGRIQGTVRLSAIIDKEGRIAELKIVDGHPFLVDAALAVVRKWRYRPTLLGGEPVEVATQIIVHFRLDN